MITENNLKRIEDAFNKVRDMGDCFDDFIYDIEYITKENFADFEAETKEYFLNGMENNPEDVAELINTVRTSLFN